MIEKIYRKAAIVSIGIIADVLPDSPQQGQSTHLEFVMTDSLNRLTRRHRRLDRLIDTSKAYGKQAELKALKQIRLRLKDQISSLKALPRPSQGG